MPVPDADDARRIQRMRQALAVLLRLGLREVATRGLVHDRQHPGRLACLVEDRTIVEVEPHILGDAVAHQDEMLVLEGERLATEARFEDVAVEARDLRPALEDLRTHNRRMAASGDLGIAGIVEHDAVFAPKQRDRHFGRQHEGDHRAEAWRPCLDRADRGRAPAMRRNQARYVTATRQERRKLRHDAVAGLGRFTHYHL